MSAVVTHRVSGSVRTCSSLNQPCCHRIARIWTRLYAIWGTLQQMVYHRQSFVSVDELKRAIIEARQKLPQSFIVSSTRASVNGVVVWSDCVGLVRQPADTLNSCSTDFNWHVKCWFCVPVLLLWVCFVRLFDVIKEKTIAICHSLRLLLFARWGQFIFQSWFK